MTKDDISDLKSLIQRAEECAIAKKTVESAKNEADRQLEVWLFNHTDRETKP